MNLYTFDESEIQKNYNIILELYHSTEEIEKRIKLYNQLSVLSKYLNNVESIRNLRPKEIKSYIKDKEKGQISALKDLDDLTSALCCYWCDSLRKLSQEEKIILKKNILNKEEYYNELSMFFENIIPSDIELFKSTFDKQKILVKKNLLLSRAEMIYLESIKEYYIKILYRGRLNKIIVRNTIHEFGHVSEFTKTGIGRSMDPLMDEVMATVYELLYIDYCFKEDKKSKLSEITNLFKIIRLSSLEAYILRSYDLPSDLSEIYFNEIRSMYTDIIALSIYLMKNESDFRDKLLYIKEKTPYLKALELLKNIGINEDDLIYNSINVKKMILERG